MPVDEFFALMRADAKEAAKRSLRHKFGRLSNRRILAILRPAAEQVEEWRGRSDADLLDCWFAEFARLRGEIKEAS